ncbi:MAG TPA: MBL fold metallo-hydrolase [Patescibacteria group bacterium]|nr:MBL fold metallo-hydrolase [Patescibacteria group bacterium]
MHPWREVGAGVFVRRYPFLDQTIGAIVGRERVLVVDTRATSLQARELIEDVRRLTRLPWVVANTHVHFDHAFGNAAFRPCEIWSHSGCAAALRLHGPAQRANVARQLPDLADELRATPLDPPDRTFEVAVDLDLGDRLVELRHLGRGHTDHDVIVRSPDTGILFAGDLVEHGAPPAFEDSFPLDWPSTLGLLLDLADGAVVPGHGEPVEREFVESQLTEVAFLAETARRLWPELRDTGHDPRGHAPHGLVDETARHLGWPPGPVRAALSRGLAQAAGHL